MRDLAVCRCLASRKFRKQQVNLVRPTGIGKSISLSGHPAKQTTHCTQADRMCGLCWV